MEYKVTLTRFLADQVENECNRWARDGWRLVSTAVTTSGASLTGVTGMWLFFER